MWSLGPRIRVSEGEAPGADWDQFMPTMTVDGAGRIHVTYYDDRRYEQDDSFGCGGLFQAKYDVCYAHSEDGGATWHYQRLYAESPDNTWPALEMGERCMDPHEYNGVVWYENSVWTTFTGTNDPAGSDNNHAVVFSSRIHW